MGKVKVKRKTTKRLSKADRDMVNRIGVTQSRLRRMGLRGISFDPGVRVVGLDEPNGFSVEIDGRLLPKIEALIIKAYPETADEKAMIKEDKVVRMAYEKRRKTLDSLSKADKVVAFEFMRSKTTTVGIIVEILLSVNYCSMEPTGDTRERFLRQCRVANKVCDKLVKKGLLTKKSPLEGSIDEDELTFLMFTEYKYIEVEGA